MGSQLHHAIPAFRLPASSAPVLIQAGSRVGPQAHVRHHRSQIHLCNHQEQHHGRARRSHLGYGLRVDAAVAKTFAASGWKTLSAGAKVFIYTSNAQSKIVLPVPMMLNLVDRRYSMTRHLREGQRLRLVQVDTWLPKSVGSCDSKEGCSCQIGRSNASNPACQASVLDSRQQHRVLFCALSHTSKTKSS